MISVAATLPDMPDALKGIFLDLRKEIADLREQYNKETGFLYEQIQHLLALLYGPRTEKKVL